MIEMKTKRAKPKGEYPKGMHGVVNDPTLRDTKAIVLQQMGTTGDLNVQLLDDCRTNTTWHRGDTVIIEPSNFDPRCVRCGDPIKPKGSIYCPKHDAARK